MIGRVLFAIGLSVALIIVIPAVINFTAHEWRWRRIEREVDSQERDWRLGL